MARIAHILPWPAVGGTEHATLRIALAVDRDRFASVAFCVPGADAVRTLFEQEGFECATYQPATPSYRRAIGFIRDSIRLARQFRRRRIDLVHCADLLAAHHAALAGWLARVPVVCHIRNRFDDVSRRDCSFLWPVKRFVFVSQSTWEHFGCQVIDRRGLVVYDGIDVMPRPTSAGAAADVRREFGIPGDAPIIGMIARVAPQKDYPTLIRAAARVLAVEPCARFLIAGDHSSAQTYRDHFALVNSVLAKERVGNAFIFAGHRQDVTRLLSALDVFVLSTHWEGLPLVVLEAMAQGKPVVATAVDGIPEIVHDESTGLLVAHEDVDHLADRLTRLLVDREWASRLGRAGRDLVQREFTVRRFGDHMNALYDDMLEGGRSLRYRISAAPAR
jgi:glycosyltransferase involved in cell wall biosynthesis